MPRVKAGSRMASLWYCFGMGRDTSVLPIVMFMLAFICYLLRGSVKSGAVACVSRLECASVGVIFRVPVTHLI